ncbi:MAG: ACP S-malonyltransferase [Victivallales bacterium]|nr:ACP S-malonyltransferase [Victivallales bacterium]
MEKTGYMFAGQGAQFPGMGAKLVESSQAAAKVFEQADKVLGYSISDLCFKASIEELTPCAVCQPTIFTVSVACFKAYTEAHPDAETAATAGLSLGEYSAAVAAKVLTFEDGLKLIAERGRLMDKCCREYPGGMAAVLGAEPAVVADICQQCDIDVANYNCPGQIVISGAKQGLDKALELLGTQKIRAVPLTVAGAYHSRLMQAAADKFAKALEATSFAKPECPFFQNVTGQQSTSPDEIRENMRKQVSGSVHWEDCARGLMTHSQRLVECGPGTVLSGFMKRIDRSFPAGPAFPEL